MGHAVRALQAFIPPSELKIDGEKSLRMRRSLSSFFTFHNSLFTRNGFTLLELAVVVFIIAMLAALVFPSFYGSDNKIKAEARKVASLLRYLNDNAIATKDAYSLKIDLQSGALTWKGPEGEETEKLSGLSAVDLQSQGTIREGEVTVFFDSLGIRENLAISLHSEDKDMTVSINPVSGRVKITEGGQG